MVALWILAAIALLILLISFICFHMAFYQKKQKPASEDEIPIPEGEIYEPYREKMENWTREVRAIPHEDVQIVAYDGLILTGKFYEYAPGAPIELMFHGYRGNAEKDLPGGVQRGFAMGRSVLLADQRCCGNSQGRVITFGIREHRDCLSWIEFMLQYFGPDVKIILTGISMGAATVLMAAGRELPENVIGVLADCGYSSPKAIIKKVIGQMGLPVELSYPFVKLGARIYGGFDLEAYSPLEAVKNCKVPVIFYHGEDDAFVPCDMSRQVYDACTSRKQIVTVPGAGHGLSYAVAPALYLDALGEFFGPEASFICEEV
ncbi:MAG: alpha/beta hydrolase [Oscillospiraceae bacterium]|nr:alpha/beta hydrolase [Oscillospiraceae bacterium]